MKLAAPLLAGVVLAAVASGQPAHAWWFEDDGQSWPVFAFHEYGGDVNRPPTTPDDPHWHNDDAVPLGMRWRDLDAARAEAAFEQAALAAEAEARRPVLPPTPRPMRHLKRRTALHHQPERICVPRTTAAR